jgi:hypothetical protein
LSVTNANVNPATVPANGSVSVPILGTPGAAITGTVSTWSVASGGVDARRDEDEAVLMTTIARVMRQALISSSCRSRSRCPR